MRALAVLLSFLLLLVPLGLAQSGEGGSSTSASSGPACEAEECDSRDSSDDTDGRGDRQNQGEDGNATSDADDDGNATDDNAADDNATDEEHGEADEERLGPGCRNGNRTADELRRCKRAMERIGAEPRLRWIGFQADPVNATLVNYTIAGTLALAALNLDLDGANLSLQRAGSTLFVRDGESELRLHDEPNGLIRFKASDGNVTLVFPAEATIERSEHGARIGYGDRREGHLLADNATWLANGTVRLQGFFAFHMPPAGANQPPEAPVAQEAKERVQDAIERRGIGAEVVVRGPAASGAALVQSVAPVEVLAYDDVEVHVEVPPQAADAATPLRVVVSSELDEGRTIVLDLDASLLESTDPADLVLRYFDLHNQTDGSTLETEVIFRQAASLQDILDAGDDTGQPEYWVVEDANGVQVLVSVPHWSAHAITVSSLVQTLDAPSVIVGVSLGAFMTVTFGLALFWPRRRQDGL